MEDKLIKNGSEHTISTILNTIYDCKVSIEHCNEFDLYIARTGIFITPQKNTYKKFFIGGFSCKTDKQQAIQIARFETAERVLATYEMSHEVMKNAGYSGYAITGEISSDLVDPRELLIYLGENDFPTNDAVGLSFHSDLQMAISHAVSELIERWLLARIWYENAPITLMDRKKVGEKYTEQYTMSLKNTIPFVMTIIYDENLTFLTLGASLSQNFLIAQSKSLSEACMLSHDILWKKNYGMISNKDSLARMHSQNDPVLAGLRYSYIKSIQSENRTNFNMNDSYQLTNIIERLELPLDCVKYCILHQSKKYFLVRAYSCELLSLKRYRERYRNTKFYLLDPVC